MSANDNNENNEIETKLEPLHLVPHLAAIGALVDPAVDCIKDLSLFSGHRCTGVPLLVYAPVLNANLFPRLIVPLMLVCLASDRELIHT